MPSTDEVLRQDESARAEALDVSRSLLLQAPAGSGKTTVLAARFLAVLAGVEAPEEILAVTFTRKAAAEMRHRILAALHAAGTGHSVPGIAPQLLQAVRQRDQERGWDLLLNPARLRIETFDALNHFLACQLPVSARCGPRLDIAQRPAVLYQRAARRTLEEAWHDPDLIPAAELLFARLDGSWRRFEQLLGDMLARRSHWLPHVLSAQSPGIVARVRDSLDALVSLDLAQALVHWPSALRHEGEALAVHAAHVRARLGDATDEGVAAWLVDGGELKASPHDLPRWRFVCDLALTAKGDWRQRHTRNEGFETADKPTKQRVRDWVHDLGAQSDLRQWLCHLRALPTPLSATDAMALQALATLLRHAAAQLLLVFAGAGKVDYAYVAAAARMSLSESGEPTPLALRIGAAWRHLLVDEFQDTSYDQFELLRALTVGWEQGDGRTLFVVGDPMQSIYQFREAEVGLFLRARDRGVGELTLTGLQLRRNFRSAPAVVAWVNGCFARLFPAGDDPRLAAIRYLPSASAAAEVDGRVELHCFNSLDPYADEEARRAVQIVRAARDEDPGATIAVLVASRAHVVTIIPALQRAGYAVRGVELEPLGERPVVRDLAALTRALLHRADRTAWLALLRAPWCGLTLAQLEALGGAGESSIYQGLVAALQDPLLPADAPLRLRLARVHDALAPAIDGIERAEPLWQRVEMSWLRLGGPACCDSERDLDDAYCFLDALAQHDDPERLVGEGLQELTTPLHSRGTAVPGAIDVMTMHASKGLEWDVVLVPGLGRGTKRDNDPLLHWIELPRDPDGSDLLLAPIRATDKESPVALGAYIKQWRRRRLQIERVRLLYVVATRARRALHLFGAVEPRDGEPATPARGSLLEMLWPAIGTEFLHAAAPAAPADHGLADDNGAPTVASAPPLRRFPAQWVAIPPPPAPVVTHLSLSLRTAAPAPEYSWVGATARAVGTIVHAELNRLADITPLPVLPPDAGGAGDATLIKPAARYRDWLADLGIAPHEREDAVARIHAALHRTLSDPRGRWLLDATHRQAHSELRLSGVVDGRIVNQVLDRTFIDEQSRRWIVDYKTSTHEGAGRDAFIANEIARYRGQLLRYEALARHLGPEPVKLALYFPLLGEFCPVESQDLERSGQ